MERIIKPRFAPRGFVDFSIGITIGLFQTIVLFGIPGVVVGFVSRNILMGFLGYSVSYLIFLLFVVWKVRLDDDGMHFYRVLGKPKTLMWSQINSIEEVGRKEILIKGWLWPFFPPRESTPCLSAKRHLRITWANGFCYFPPNDVELFYDTILKLNVKRPSPTFPQDAKQPAPVKSPLD